MARCNCAPHPTCNPKPNGPSPLNYDGNRQAPHPYVYWMSRRTVNVEAGKNVDVELCVDEPTGDKTYTVSAKTDPEVTSHLQQLDSEVARKAEKTYVDRELAKKADKSYVNAKLNTKADKTYVEALAQTVAHKADKSYVDDKFSRKADKTYVDELAGTVARKADKTYVDNKINSLTDVVNSKANKSYVDAALATKVDKVDGKGLSTNDFTNAYKAKLDSIETGAEVNVQSDWNETDSSSDAYLRNKPEHLVQDANYVHTDNNYTSEDKEKLTSITWLPEAELGEDTSLVNTGEKYTWNHKQDVIEYYLADASITDEGALVITKKDGTTVTFTGNENAAIDHIATPDQVLPIVNKTVTIPLATAALNAGDSGEAGLVQGVYEIF